MTRFKIGDCLYDLFTDPDGQMPDEVVMWPVVKVTKCFVDVHGPRRWNADRIYRFSRADLEDKGRAWNQKHRIALYARPMNNWPLLVVDVRPAERLAIAAAEMVRASDGDEIIPRGEWTDR